MTDDMHDFSHSQIAAVMPEPPGEALLDSLTRLGAGLEVEVVSGADGLAHLDPDGSEHGLVAKMKRTVQEEQRPITMLADAIESGDEIVFVHHVDDDNVKEVAASLSENGATLMFHFGDYTWRRLGG